MWSISNINCASQCLAEEKTLCLAYEFDKSTEVCKLSADVADEDASCKHSPANIYSGTVNSSLLLNIEAVVFNTNVMLQ